MAQSSGGTPTIRGNVFGGGRMADVTNTATQTVEDANKVTATIDIYASTIEKGVFGGNDITGTVAQATGDGKASAKITIHDKCNDPCSVHEVYGGGNGYYKYKIGENTIEIGTITEANRTTVVDANTLVKVLDAENNEVAEFYASKATTYGGLLPILVNTYVTIGEATDAKNKIDLPEVYGGAKNAYVTGASNVTVENCTIGTVYGGNNYGGNIESTNVYIKGGAQIGTTETPGAVYGGGRSADVLHHTNVTVASSTPAGGTEVSPTIYGNVFGGCDISGNVGNCTLACNNADGSEIANVHLSDAEPTDATTADYTFVKILGGKVTNRVFGGGNGLQAADGTSYYTGSLVSTGTAPLDVYTYPEGSTYAGKQLPICQNTYVKVVNATIGTTVSTSENEVHTCFAGGQGAGTKVMHNAYTLLGTTNSTDNTLVNGILYGGSLAGLVNSSCEDVTKTTLLGFGNTTSIKGDVYGGSYGNHVRGKIDLNINNISVGVDENAAGIYAGNNSAGQPECEASINFVGDDCNLTLYGGGNKAPFYGTTRITFTTGRVGYIYGGGNHADVFGNTIVEVLGGHVCHDVFGGGNNGKVRVNKATDTEHNSYGKDYGGNTLVIVRDDCLQPIADAAGKNPGDEGYVDTFQADALSGNRYANRDNTKFYSTYFGGNDPYVDNKSMYILKPNASGIKSEITIEGNVFGGGNAADVEGKATVIIGNKQMSE